MSNVERITKCVEAMWGKNIPTCHHTVALYHVLYEHAGEASPERVAVQAQVDKMLANEREWCMMFDNLRSLVATLERSEGVERPVFYEGGELCGRRCQQAEMLKRRPSDGS